MGLFSRKNEQAHSEDVYQVRFVLTNDYDPENNSEIKKLLDEVAEGQEQNGELSIKDTLPFATFKSAEEFFKKLRDFAAENNSPITFSYLAIWGYNPQDKWKPGRINNNDGNPHEFITVRHFELDYDYQNLTKVFFEEIFNNPENDMIEHDHKVLICDGLKEAYIASTNASNRDIARIPTEYETNEGRVTLDVPSFSVEEADNVEDYTPVYNPDNGTFASASEMADDLSDAINTDQSQYPNIDVPPTTPQQEIEQTLNDSDTEPKNIEISIEEQAELEAERAKNQVKIEIPKFDVDPTIQKEEIGRDGYIDYKINERKKYLNNRLTILGNKINDDNAKQILQYKESYHQATQKAIDEYASSHRKPLDDLFDNVKSEMIELSDSEKEKIEKQLKQKEAQELAQAKRAYEQSVAQIKNSIHDNLVEETKKIDIKYDDLFHKKYDEEFAKGLKKLNDGMDEIRATNERTFDVQLRENIAQIKMNGSEAMEKILRQCQEDLDEAKAVAISENMNAKKVIVAEQQAKNEEQRLAAPIEEIKQKDSVITQLNSNVAALTAERDALIKQNQSLKVDNDEFKRKNDELLKEQLTKSKIEANKAVEKTAQDSKNLFEQFTQYQLQKDINDQKEHDQARQKLKEAQTVFESQQESLRQAKIDALEKSSKNAKIIATGAIAALMFGGAGAGLWVHNNNESNNDKISEMDKKLSSTAQENSRNQLHYQNQSASTENPNEKALVALHSNNLDELNKYSTEEFYDLDKAIINNDADGVENAVRKMNNLNLKDKYRATQTESLLEKGGHTDLAEKVSQANS